MVSKKVSDLIIDKFTENIKKDSLFENISGELTSLFTERKHSKEEIENLLRKKDETARIRD